MILRDALRIAVAGIRANFLPGLLLQCLMVAFLGLYLAHEGTRRFLAHVAEIKMESGYLFAMAGYVFSSALLPEILRILFFQGGRPTRRNLWMFATGAPLWAADGALVDFFYRCQTAWFGPSHDLATVLIKMAVDQFVFSPFLSVPLLVLCFGWRDEGFRPAALGRILRPRAFSERILSVQVAGWCIWIPGVCLVYFMPSDLQIPIAVLIQCFWVLVFTFVNRPPAVAKRAAEEIIPSEP